LTKTAFAAVLLLAGAAHAAPVRIMFDGADAPIGAADFAHAGARFTGGRVETEGVPGLHASGAFFYDLGDDGGTVSFAAPVSGVRFFFVHGFGFAPGTATAHDAAGNAVATVQSRKATHAAAPDGFVAFSTATPIARIAFAGGGVIDDFAFDAATTADAPITAAITGSWINTTHAPFLDGQGVFLEFTEANRQLFVAWFTFDRDGSGHRWLTASGPADGATATLEVSETRGGQFNRPSTLARTLVGSMTLQLATCDRATVNYDFAAENASGTFELTRARSLLPGAAPCSTASPDATR
jgi:hypothetical protein